MRTDLMPDRAHDLPARAKHGRTFGEVAGQAWWARNKGDAYLSALRVWILPVMGASAASKYLGFSGRRAILLWIGVAVTSEVLSIALGWLERRIGATQANFAVSTETDPYKARSLALLEEIRDALRNRRRA